MTDKKISLLFLCTGNSCRSQMAEGFCKHFFSDRIAVQSAGIKKHGLNPVAVKAMQELGIDISKQYSKTVEDLDQTIFDYVITLCGHANETCPFFPAKTKIIHQGFEDPPTLALTAHTEEEALNHYRRVRDEIKTFVLSFPELLITNH